MAGPSGARRGVLADAAPPPRACSQWRDKVLLVQIAVPTRTEVPEYQKLRSTVHEIVGRINGRFGTLTHVPIHHLDRSLVRWGG